MGNVSINNKLKTTLFFLLSQLSPEKQMIFSFNTTGNRNVNIESLQASDWVSLQKHEVNEHIENRQELTSLKEPQIHLLDYLLSDSQEGERLNYQPFLSRRWITISKTLVIDPSQNQIMQLACKSLGRGHNLNV